MLKKKTASPVSDINVTPMVDVMLVILIIFMVITPLLNKGMNVDMVKTKNPVAMGDAEKEDAVLIAITRDGKTYMGTNVMAPDSLPSKVKDMLSSKLNKTVYLKADQRAKYSVVTDVVDNLRAAGVDQLGLLTEQIQAEAAKPAEKKPANP